MVHSFPCKNPRMPRTWKSARCPAVAGPLLACALALPNSPANAQAGATPATPENMEPAQRSAARGQNGATAHPPTADEVCRALTMRYECRAGEFRRSVQGYVLAMLHPKPEDVDEETDSATYADDRNFYKVEKWTRDGTKVDSLLYAGNSLVTARGGFERAIKHRPRIGLTIR
jgi:hypothetical protein